MTVNVASLSSRLRLRAHLGAFGTFLRRNKGVAVAGSVLLIMLLAGLFAPLPFDPVKPNPSETLASPSTTYWFGTDRSGLDIFSRTIVAAKLDLPLAISGALLSLVIGVPLGLGASTKTRWAERFMRGLDAFQAFPLLVLAIVIVALTGNNLRNIVVAIALINVPRFIRLTRSEALALRESRFIEAAMAIGASPRRVLFRHLLPNIVGTIFAQASLAVAHAIVVIAALSFLGIGITPPDASWGAMIREGSQTMATGQWWVATAPGVAVFIAVVSFHTIADGLLAHFERADH